MADSGSCSGELTDVSRQYGHKRIARTPFQKARRGNRVVKSHAQNQKIPTKLSCSILIFSMLTTIYLSLDWFEIALAVGTGVVCKTGALQAAFGGGCSSK
jgi:hypothetical protein